MRSQGRLTLHLTIATSAAVVTLALVPAHAATAGPQWASLPIDQLPGSYSITAQTGLACTASNNCFVGVSVQQQNAQTNEYSGAYVQRWNGKRFVTTSSGVPSSSELDDITCPTSDDCLIAGALLTNGVAPLIDRWNGSAWHQVDVPHPSGGSWFEGVACQAKANCVGVGGRLTSGSTYHAFAERWNGTRWSMMTVPHPAGQSADQLYGVSCPTRHRCIAIGVENEQGRSRTYSDIWNGRRWHLVTVPAPPKGSFSDVESIDCPSKDSCFGAGYVRPYRGIYPAHPVIYRWNGSGWRVARLATRVKDRLHVFNDVACASATSCVAVGWGRNKSGYAVAMSATWTGQPWSFASFPNDHPKLESYLDSVGCWRQRACYSQGYRWTDGAETQLSPLAGRLSLPQ